MPDKSPFPPAVQPAELKERLCKECGDLLPIEAFGDRKDGICCACGRDLRLQRAAKRQSDMAINTMASLLSEVRRPAMQMPRIEEMLTLLVDKMGGLDTFVSKYVEYLNRLLAKNPPTSAVANHMFGIFKLVKEANVQQHQEDVDRMNLDQTEKALQVEALKALMASQQNPRVQRLLEELQVLEPKEAADEREPSGADRSA